MLLFAERSVIFLGIITLRSDKRKNHELRPIFLGPGFAKFADGSCFVKFGNTHVLCAATIEERVPFFMRNTRKGWITAEYGMLPRCSHERIEREAVKGKQSGRTHEIQRLIGRSLRSVVDLEMLGERSIKIDCDVLQADGGTRTASITGAYVAMHQAVRKLFRNTDFDTFPIRDQIAAVSCGVVNGEPMLDLNYTEDFKATVDSNFVMSGSGDLVEIQASGEERTFSEIHFNEMLKLAKAGIAELIKKQKEALNI